MATRAEKLRRRQHRKEKSRRPAREVEAAAGRISSPLIIDNPPGEVKMSEVLMDLVRPEWGLCSDGEAMNKLLTLGAAAWNAALTTGAERTALLDRLAATMPPEVRQDFHRVVEPLIRRKEKLFPHLRRPIISFELTVRSSGEPYLRVLSGLWET